MDFAAPAASSFLSDQKATKESPGVCSDGQVTSILIWMWPVHSRYTPRPPLRGELDSKARRKNTGAGWPLTPYLSPARCHCVAKPESCPCYPFRRASTGAPPWCSVYRMLQPCRAGACPRHWFCVVLPVFPVGAAPCGRPHLSHSQPNG